MCFEWAWKIGLAARAAALLLSHQTRGGSSSNSEGFMPCLMLYDNYKNIFLFMVSFGLDIYTHNFFEQSLVCFRYELNSD